ncbi:hypothetical protein CC86DRAFT_381867 [Ophiobolus disseminans]|uniref:Uncharacterized protein n=1 Tax=Ophiobolus disseminans TaxID=1469910 RepID=A0A6A7A0C5_9PLEO|nr:hypothetical protein CC86DRAFT_381867 [Ophiobolus disseminans]
MAASPWAFPPPADPGRLPPGYVSRYIGLDRNILNYLNASTTEYPLSGFGRTLTYHADLVTIKWPTPDNFQSPHRTWYCMQCSQSLNATDEAQNWNACRYAPNASFPILHSLTFDIDQDPVHNKVSSHFSLNHVPRLPDSTKNKSLMCSDDKVSRPFRFFNRPREDTTGQNSYIFNVTLPEGQELDYGPIPTDKEMKERERKRRFRDMWGEKEIAGLCVGMVILAAILIWTTVCWVKRRKAKKAANVELEEVNRMVQSREEIHAPPTYETAVRQGKGQ